MKSRLQTLLIVKERKRRRSQKSVKTRRSLRQVSLVSLIVLLIVVTSIPVIIGYYYTQLTTGLPSTEWIPAYLDPENGILLYPTVLLDKNNENEIYHLEEAGNPRRFLPLDPNLPEFISPYVVQLTVAVYQPDFWSSPGYNRNLLSTDSDRTIAERLVEKLLLWDEPQNLNRILRMRLLAAQITEKYGRAQVLEWYLNSSAYGHNTIGVDAAARLYLNKNASELNLAEAALLVSTSLTPALNPLDAPQAALENQENLLTQLHEEGFVSDEDFNTAIKSELVIVSEIQEQDQIASAFSALVMNKLYALYGRERVELGGFRVTTTLDHDIQQALKCTLITQLKRVDGSESNIASCPPDRFLPSLFDEAIDGVELMGSGIILDPRTGEILAMVGDLSGDGESPSNTRKQGGTILTPLIAVNAFARGFSPATQVWDIPANLSDNLSAYQLPIEAYKGPMRFRSALANDYLTGVNRLFDQIGFDVVSRSANSFGLTTISNLDPVQEMLFSGENTTIVEVANFYSIFATLGTHYGNKNPANGLIEQKLLRQVEMGDGLVLDEFQTDFQAILSPQLAYLTHDILRDDYERRATLGYPNLLDLGRPSGAKFGTTFMKDEIWTAGYTPQYVSVIWFGQSETDPIELNPKIAGGVWYAMMQWLHQNVPVENWEKPSGISEVVVCNLSGLRPTRECPATISEIFIDGAQPAGYDNLFKSYEINRETGLLATVFTPADMVETRTYMLVPEDALDWAIANRIAVPPKDYDLIQAPKPSEDALIISPANYSYVSGIVDIMGTVQTQDLTSYRIQIGQGLNPASWLQIGEDLTRKISKRKIVEWDTTGIDDGLYAMRLMVIREDFQVDTHTIQVSVDNTPPTGKIIYPTAGRTIPRSSQGTITLQAEAFDSTGIERVEWWLDGKIVGNNTQMPYSYPISINAGKHTVYIKIYDVAGNEIISSEFEFVVE
ncbi:MAG: penicillin-binding protein [Anaerolineaceae bacterium]|nr:penicillin-binding protein [Anaerolineaceae bacterium]